jgi:tetratricopeptide (TPR) repeat protein
VNRARARQWSRTAFALAALFASFPIAGRLLLGEWAFDGATGIACLWLAAGAYLHIRATRVHTLADPAALVDDAMQLARLGDIRRAFRVLDRAIAENPRFWQALQCRAEVRLHLGDTGAAVVDLDRAIGIAPEEAHLRELRAYAEGRRSGVPEAEPDEQSQSEPRS